MPSPPNESECVFCEISAGRAVASFVYEDDDVLAFMDLQPVNPGGVVIIPRRHVGSLSNLDDDVGGRMFNVAVRVQRAIRASELRCDGINIFLSDGEIAGQDVFHTHLIVVPRVKGDTLRITCEWPEPRPREELDRNAGAIRGAWSPA